MMQTVHAQETSSVNPSGPSMERRQRRVLALVEHMALIDQLINIFEQGGGMCDLRNGTKVFPWTTLPAQLAAKQLYFTGWPECCLPRPSGIHRNAVDPASDPMWWSAEQRAAMRAQIDAQQIFLCRRTPQSGEAPFIFEFVDIHRAVRRTLVGFSTKWYHRMGRPGSGFMLSANTSPINGDSVQPEFIPSTSFLDTYFHSLGSHDAPASASSPSPPAVKQEEGDNEVAAAEPTSTTTSIRTLPQHLESRLRRLLEGIPNKVLSAKRRRASSSHSSRAHSHRDSAADGEKENALREWARAAHGRSQNEERPTKKRRGEQHPGSSSASSLEEANVNYSPAPSLHVLPYHTQPDMDAHAFTRGRDPMSRKRISKQPRIAISARVVHGPSPTPGPMNPSRSPLFFHQGESHSTPSLSYPTSSPFSHTPPTSLSPAHALPTPASQPTLARSIHQRHQRFNSGTSPAGYIPPRDHGVDVLPISPFSPAHTHSPFSPVPSQSPFTPALSQSPSFASPPPEDASR